MTLSEALDIVYGPGVQWDNPIRPHSITGVNDTPYEAWQKLKPEYQEIVSRMIGRKPRPNDE